MPLHDLDILGHRPRSAVDGGGVRVPPAAGDHALFAQVRDALVQRADGAGHVAGEVGLEPCGRHVLHDLVGQPGVFVGGPVGFALATPATASAG